MKKISILIYSLASGGAERQVSIVLKELHLKYKIYLVLMNDTLFYEVPKNVEIIYLEKSSPIESAIKKLLKLPILAFRYKKFLKEKDVDISLSLMTRPNYINSLAKLFGSDVKTIISERSMFSLQYSYDNLQSYINKKLVKLYNVADLIVTNSQGNGCDLEESFGIKREKQTIYNAVDLHAIETLSFETVAIKKDTFTFVTIGRLDSGKNHKLLIEAVKNLDCELWIIGDGELRSNLELRIENLKLNDKVKLLGRQKNPYKFLSRADCFVFSSNHEGFPNVLLEALVCGLPVLSTDCKSGPREILSPHSDCTKQTTEIELVDFGILMPVDDVAKMIKAMKMIIKDDNLREEYRKKALQRAQEFRSDEIIKEWEVVLSESN